MRKLLIGAALSAIAFTTPTYANISVFACEPEWGALSSEIGGDWHTVIHSPEEHSTTIVLADVTDDPNGFATPLPYPLVHIRAIAPDGTD